jgi:1,2-diacylglycerol 3-alpha-glucosyltransferase
VLPGQKDFRAATYLPGQSLVFANKMDLDIVHGHNGGPVTFLGWEVSKVKRVPFVYTYHTMFSEYTHYIFQGKVVKPKMAELATRVFGNMCDTVVVPSVKVKNELESYGVKRPTAVIPGGVDLSVFYPRPRGFLRDRFDITDGQPLLLCVCRLSKEKSLETLIRSFTLILNQTPEAMLILVGDGPDRRKLETLVHQMKLQHAIKFTGFVDPKDMPKVYSDGDVFVYTSRSETQGLVLVEAMACGLPVVTVDDPAYDGIVRPGHNGLIARRGAQGFARSVEHVLESPKTSAEMSIGALATAKDFSLETAVDKLEALYASLIRE